MLAKTEGTIKNRQSRHTGNIGVTRHKTQDQDKIEKTQKHNTTQKTKNIEQHGSHHQHAMIYRTYNGFLSSTHIAFNSLKFIYPTVL